MRELNTLSAAFAIVGEFNRRGLIHWQVKDNLLLIEESLAVLFIQQGRDGFYNFLNRVSDWQNYRIIRDAYERHRLRIETDAVREAQSKEGRVVTKADIQRIRQHAREQMPMLPPEEIPCFREFDIMVIRASAPSAAEATEENGQLVALGHFDGKRLEMALYDEIKHNLDNGKEAEQ